MNSTERLKRMFVELYSLSKFQQSLRMGLRALWMGVAGIILGWAIHAIWGVLPNPATWVLLGLFFSLFPIAVVVASLTPPSQWVWQMDRRLGFRQQLSTAWEVVNQKPATKRQSGLLGDLLVQDVLTYVPRLRSRMMREGWFHKLDLFASLIVLMLACMVMALALLSPPQEPATDTPAQMVPMTAPEMQPAPQEEQTGGQPAQNGQGGEQNQTGGEDGESGEGEEASEGQGQSSENSGSEGMNGAVQETLQDLGSDLSQQAGTYKLGEALENLDLNEAAQELEELSEQIDDLSPESRKNLQEALEEAAQEMEQAGEEDLSESMGQASDSLSEAGSDAEANQAMDNLADDLQELANGGGGGGNSSSGENPNANGGTGAPEPLPQLTDEGGDFNLPLTEPADSGLLSPQMPDEPADGTASGSLDSASRGGDAGQSPLLPNTFPWKWRDVVEEYFRR